jgi:hypothetical protein
MQFLLAETAEGAEFSAISPHSARIFTKKNFFFFASLLCVS